MAKREGYFMGDICTMDNIVEGYKKSKHGKTYVHNMLVHKEFDPEEVLLKLQYDLLNGQYKTSEYTVFKIYEPKERIIFRLPYAPDRIAHHCIMNVLEPFWTRKIPNTSYSCIKGRGVSGAYRYMKKCLKDVEGTKYCLKCDIKKFFPSVNHKVLEGVIDHHIKDYELLVLLFEIVNSTDSFAENNPEVKEGYNLPIGNYLSQYFANLMIALIYNELRKRFKGVKIIIYMDDIIILASNKKILHEIKEALVEILKEFDLNLKDNWQIFSVDDRGISFVGFRFYHDKVLLRKNIIKNIYILCWKYRYRKINKTQFKRSMASYYGWIKCANTKGVCKRIYDITGLYYSNWNGKRAKITNIKDKNIRVYHIDKRKKYFIIEAIYKDKPIEVVSANKRLLSNMLELKKNNLSYNIILRKIL